MSRQFYKILKKDLKMKKIGFLLSVSMLIVGYTSAGISAENSSLQNVKEFSTQLTKLKGIADERTTVSLIAEVAVDGDKRREQSYLSKNEKGEYFISKGAPPAAFFNYRRGTKANSYVRFKVGNWELSIGNMVPSEWEGQNQKSLLEQGLSFEDIFLDTWCKGLFGGNSFDELPSSYKEGQNSVQNQCSKTMTAIKKKAENDGQELQLVTAVRNSQNEFYVWSSKKGKIGVRCTTGGSEKVSAELLEEVNIYGKTTPGKKREEDLHSERKTQEESRSETTVSEDRLEISEIINFYSGSGRNTQVNQKTSKEQLLQELGSLTKYCEELTPEIIEELLRKSR